MFNQLPSSCEPFSPCRCRRPPSTLQYPAALAHGTTVSLANLKLNGRPLLGAPLALSQAAAAEGGCLAQLYRLPSKATKAGFVLSGWVALEGASAFGGGGGTVPAAGFGPGEMSSVELTLGEYSLLDAATSRLLGGMGAPQAQHPPSAGAAQPQR